MRKIVSLLVIISLLLSIAACAKRDDSNVNIKGEYQFEKIIYLIPSSSVYVTNENAPKYIITEDTLTIQQTGGTQVQIEAPFTKSEVDVNEFASSFMPGFSIPSISEFNHRYQYSVNDQFRLYVMDGKLWIAQLQQDKIWSIYQLIKTKEN